MRGTEECDDDNNDPEDGCSATCQSELEILPSIMSMLVGDIRALQVVNRVTGAIETGISLTVADPAIASIDVDPTMKITGLTAGTTTIYGGGASAQITVFAGTTLPPGTVRWTAPSDGSGFVAAVPAIPSDDPAAISDVFTLETSGRVQGLTSDGLLTWTGNIASGAPEFEPELTQVLPDTRGGFLALNVPARSITRLDPATGQTSWVYSPASGQPVLGSMAVRPDGTVLFIEGSTEGPPTGYVVGLDGNTGLTQFRITIEHTIDSSDGGCEGQSWYVEGTPALSPLVVTANGVTHLAYLVGHVASGGDCFDGGTTSMSALKLLTVDQAGGASVATLHSATASTSYHWNEDLGVFEWISSAPIALNFSSLIAPSSDTATLVWSTWTGAYSPYCRVQCDPLIPATPVQETLASVNAGGILAETTVNSAGEFAIRAPVVAGQGGVLFAPVTMVADSSPRLAAISSGGTVLWTEAGQFEPIVATKDGGVVARQLGETEQVVFLGVSDPPDYVGLGSGAKYSWLGDWYSEVTVPELGPVAASVEAPSVEVAESAWCFENGNPSGTQAATYSLNSLIRELIATVAEGYQGSTNWVDDAQGSKCNLFVKSVLAVVGTAPPYETNLVRRIAYMFGGASYRQYPALAADWADKGKVFQCWRTLEAGPDGALSGDVIAEPPLPGHVHGHVGIVVIPGYTASTNSLLSPSGVIDINDFGFRPDDPEDALFGQKRHAVVKRFTCN